MIFVEGFRLFLVIAGAIAGLASGNSIDKHGIAPVVGLALGAFVAYVVGGVAGRLLDKGMEGVVGGLRRMPAGEVFAGTVVGTSGLLIGLVAGLPLIALVHSSIDYPVVAALAWAFAAFGVRLGVVEGPRHDPSSRHLEVARPGGGASSDRDARRRHVGGDGPVPARARARRPARGRSRPSTVRDRRGPHARREPRSGHVTPGAAWARGGRDPAGRRRRRADRRRGVRSARGRRSQGGSRRGAVRAAGGDVLGRGRRRWPSSRVWQRSTSGA